MKNINAKLRRLHFTLEAVGTMRLEMDLIGDGFQED